MSTTEIYQKFLQDQREISNAINRLDQRHTDIIEQHNNAVSELTNALESWAKGTLTEEALNTAYANADFPKSMYDPEPFRLAKESLEAEIKRLSETHQKLRHQTVVQERLSKYKKLFNTALASGKKLSDNEKNMLRSTVTIDYSRDLDKLFAGLNDFHFKFEGRSLTPTFQEYSKIDYYPVQDTTENTTQPKER